MEKLCGQCSIVYVACRSDAKFCSKLCRDRSWRKNNPDKRQQQYLRNKGVEKATMKKYYESHKDECKTRATIWKKSNPGKVNANTAARAAQKILATPSWVNKNLIRDLYVEASTLGLQVDHIVPLRSPIVCGLHCEDNLQLLSARENIEKSNILMADA